MKTLLVLALHPDLADAIRSAVNPEHYRVLHRSSLEDAEPLLGGLVDICVMDLDLDGAQGVWQIKKLRARALKVPVIVVAGTREPQWVEEAYGAGVAEVLEKPLRPRLFTMLLERVPPAPTGAAPAAAAVSPPRPTPGQPQALSDTSFMTTGTPPIAAAQFLPLLRNFSGILIHSLNAEGMLNQFLVFLRDLLSINRGVIFLSQPAAAPAAGQLSDGRRLRAFAATGIRADLLQHFELSFSDGIGGHVSRLGRILRRTSEEARQILAAQKEFELLGTQVAVPIYDRESVIGVALFDGRITGEALTNSELELIFHLLEPLGLAVKNIWLHDQVAANQQMMAGILRELSSACVVVGKDLSVLHANKTARKHFARASSRSGEVEFSDLPEAVGTLVYQVLKTGSASEPFRYSPETQPNTVYSVVVVPFQLDTAGAPASALLIGENITHAEQVHRLELEAQQLRMVAHVAATLAHSINNAAQQLSLNLQLIREKWKDPNLRDVLIRGLDGGVNRVSRLGDQMRYLAGETSASTEPLPLVPLLEEAFLEAAKHHGTQGPPLDFKNADPTLLMPGDRLALRRAFSELLLNALQAAVKEPRVIVRAQTLPGNSDGPMVQVEIEDNGSGFSDEFWKHGQAPFYGTRAVGVGLGLEVAKRIVERHGGKLELVKHGPGQGGLVRVTLPSGGMG